MNTTYIYGLKEKKGEIRYIGKANDPKRRLRQHKSNARKEKSHKVSWIKYCQQNNIEIELVILEECDYNIWQEKEIYWISQFQNLTNHDKGGRGGKPEKYSFTYEETKKWIKINLPNINTSTKWENNSKFLPDFLRDGNSLHKIGYNFLNYEGAKEWCLNNKIKSNKIYKKMRPTNCPAHPEEFYKNSGWTNWSHFLYKKSPFLSYEEAKKWCLNNFIVNSRTYKLKKPINLPACPNKVYKNSGWTNWFEFLNV